MTRTRIKNLVVSGKAPAKDRPDKAVAPQHAMPSLTGLRGLAALWVLLHHAWAYVTPREILLDIAGQTIKIHVLFSLGWAGVQVLFVLSAFLLTLPYARANAGLGPIPSGMPFLIRRFARVFPAYYGQLLVLFLIGWLLYRELIVSWDTLPYYLSMLFVPPPFGVGSPDAINGVWWTLPIELSFYLVLPVIAGLASWKRCWQLVALSLLSMCAWRYFVIALVAPVNELPMWTYQLPGSFDSFGIGMLGAVLHVRFSEQRSMADSAGYDFLLKGLLFCAPIAWLLLAAWLDARHLHYWTIGPLLFLWTPLFSLLVLVLILNGARNNRILDKVLGNPVVFYLGVISYGVYLWHPPIGRWLLDQPLISELDSYPFPRLALLMLVLSVIAASISWFLIERVSITAARKRTRRS